MRRAGPRPTPSRAPGRSRRTARRGRRPRRGRRRGRAAVKAMPSGVWRAAPSSSVPMSWVVCRPICSKAWLTSSFIIAAWLWGSSATRRASARPAASSSSAGTASEASPHSTARRAVDRVAGEQQALGALQAEAVHPHRRRRRAPHARRRVADAAVLGADDEVRAQREVGAAGDAVAVDLGDDRLGRAPQRHVGVDEAAHGRVVGDRVPRRARLGRLHRLRAPADVVARAERAPGAAQAHDADVVVGQRAGQRARRSPRRAPA